MFERQGKDGYKSGLENTLELDSIYGHPHKAFKTIHVAGTNGKGTVSHSLAALLQNNGQWSEPKMSLCISVETMRS